MKRIALFLILLSIFSCQDDDSNYTEINQPLDFIVPANFPETAQDIGRNFPTQKGFELGRKLFYDGRLSRDGTVSCSFCHEQSSAFTHHGHDFSHGIDNLAGIRNAPAVQNMAFQSEYFYDGASNSLEMLSIVPIHNPVEMDETLENIVSKLKYRTDIGSKFITKYEMAGVSISNANTTLGNIKDMLKFTYNQNVKSEPKTLCHPRLFYRYPVPALT